MEALGFEHLPALVSSVTVSVVNNSALTCLPGLAGHRPIVGALRIAPPPERVHRSNSVALPFLKREIRYVRFIDPCALRRAPSK